MSGPSRPSFPAPSEPSLRRLGVGSGSGGERPLRAQLVVALVSILILLAVPLYLWRRPTGAASPGVDGGVRTRQLGSIIEAGAAVITDRDAALANERVRLGEPQRVKCGSSPKDTPQQGSLCDPLPGFEEALAKAIRDTVECAPKAKEEGSINFVLNVHFPNKNVHVFPGASGKWKGRQARRATECVKKALSQLPWDTVQHQYRFYAIAILATYPPPPPIPGPPDAPLFE